MFAQSAFMVWILQVRTVFHAVRKSRFAPQLGDVHRDPPRLVAVFAGDGLNEAQCTCVVWMAVLLSATVALTLTRATLSGSNGNLKCYSTAGIEKVC